MSEDNQQNQNPAPEDVDPTVWIQNQRGAVLGYCSRKELGVVKFIDNKSAILPPFIAIWLVESKPSREKYWVISGDLPLDHINVKQAKTPRDVVRHFSLNWQLKAERLIQSLVQGKPQLGDQTKQTDFANMLVRKANMLYELAEKDKIWVNHES